MNVSEFETHNPRFSQLKTGAATSYQGPSLVIALDGRLVSIVRKIPEFNKPPLCFMVLDRFPFILRFTEFFLELPL